MAIYMKYGDVKGPVTTAGFKDWIELESVKWGADRSISSAAGGGYSREHSEPSIHEIRITKRMDKASPQLFLDAVAGKLDVDVQIKFTTTTKNQIETFMTYDLYDVGLSSYSTDGRGDMPSESMSLNFTKITYTNISMGPAVTGTPDRAGYDLTRMKAV